MDENTVTSELFSQDGKPQAAIGTGKLPKHQQKQALQPDNIFENLPDALIITDRQGRIQRVNAAAVSLLGNVTDAFELREWPARFGLVRDIEAATPYPVQELPVLRALGGEIATEEEMAIQADGKTTWITMSSRPLYGEKGAIAGTVTQVRDITARKRMEASRDMYLRRMETLYRLSRVISEGGNDLKRITQSVAVLTAEDIGDLCVVAHFNPTKQALEVGAFYDSDPTARSLFRKVLAASGTDYKISEGVAGKVVQTGKPVLIPEIPAELETSTSPEFKEFVRQIGAVSALSVPMIGRSGVLGVITCSRHRGGRTYNEGDQSFLMDIAYRTALAVENSLLFDSLRAEVSERLSAERALGISEERFRSIFESTTLGIKILDLGGNILHTNRAYQEMIGYSAEELVGRHFYDFIHPEDTSRAVRLFHDLKVSGLPDFRFEHRAAHKDGSTVWVKTTYTGVKKGGGDDSLVFIVGILENTTDQKRIQQEMSELSSRLQNAMELERLRLAQELHDGPMQELYNAIYGIEELRTRVDAELGTELEHTNREIQKVLQDLRATAKELRPPTISSFGLEKAIRSHADDFQEKHPEIKVHLSLAQDHQLLPEEVRLALFRILQHSLSNIARHSEATQVWVRFAFDAEQAMLEIKDNGRGFSVPRNWIELVRRGHYGLAGSFERIHALSGTFTVESQPGELTVIRAIVPWQEAAQSPLPAGLAKG